MKAVKKKIIRACTVSMSIGFVRGMLQDLKKKYEVILVSSPGPELDEAIARYGVRGVPVSMERHIAFFKDIRSLFELLILFRKERPSMVHSITPKAGLLCMLSAWLARVPVRVHTFTGLVWPTSKGLKRLILMTTDKVTCACATHVIPEGEGVKNDLLNNNITKKQIKVLGYGNVCGIDMQRFSLRDDVIQRASLIRKANVFTFLYVGRIVGDKGINELVTAFIRIYKNNPSARLLLVGFYEQDLDPVVDATRKAIDMCQGIEAVGEKMGDELLSYYACSDCFVLPSYREGFPNTVLEAGAMGLPCIVTDINGSREIIFDGENGLIIPSRDEHALYNAMMCMLEDTEMCQRMSGNARKMIADRFDKNFVQQCLYDFYDEILDN